jgi:hypothetical protein
MRALPRTSRLARVIAVTVLSVAAGCAGEAPERTQVGHHEVWLSVPRGWEHLDHGRQQLFRRGEEQLSLTDLGPGTRAGLKNDIQAAESLWLAGRERDAFERVRELRSPMMRDALSRERADFWRPWTDATYDPERADSAAIGTAFAALIEGTKIFPESTPDRLLQYVLDLTGAMPNREIASRAERTIHGSAWTEIETWSPVSHLGRSRVAYTLHDGDLLALAEDRGRDESVARAFEQLMRSIQFAPPRE